MKGITIFLILSVMLFTKTAFSEQILFQEDFSKGSKGWISYKNAEEKQVSRRPGSKSILIRQTNNEDAESYWLSPLITHKGGPVTISFWAAANYKICPDFSINRIFDNFSTDRSEINSLYFSLSSGWIFEIKPVKDKSSKE